MPAAKGSARTQEAIQSQKEEERAGKEGKRMEEKCDAQYSHWRSRYSNHRAFVTYGSFYVALFRDEIS